MSLGRICAQEEDIPGRRGPQQRDITEKVSSTGSCPWEEDVSGKISSSGRRHPPQGRCHPQGGVSGKVSGRGCPWEDVILRREMCLRRCLQEDTVLRKVLSGSRHIWEGDVPRKETSLGRCHPLEGDLPGTDVLGQASPAGICHWEEDVLRKEISPFKQPKPMEP